MILLSILGGIIFRFRGGWPDLPRPIEQCLFCIPILLIALPCGWLIAAVVYALSVAATTRGHGHNMDLGTWTEVADYEWYEKITLYYKLQGKIPEYWYDVGGIAISGITYTLPLLFVNPLFAPIGLLKAPAYMIGWKMHPNYDDGFKFNIKKFTLRNATEWGEFFTGLFIWAALIGVYLCLKN